MGIAGLVLGAVFLTFAIATISRNLPEPGKLITRTVAISTKIYDRTGQTLLYDIHGEIKRTPVALDKIAPVAIKATLVAEDRNFYEHAGFDLKGILRSALLDILPGGPLRGGSTITQQFIKNAVLTREKTVTRKLKELVLAYRIEKRFSKDEILNMYFNEIPYGSTVYGIEAASQTFFKKSASELDPIEAAILASLPKAPSRLSPFGNHTDELVARVQYILRAMKDAGYLSAAEADKYLKEDPHSRIKPRRDALLAPHFVFFVRDQLADRFGEDFVEQGGLKVTTTLDWKLQQIAEEEVEKGALRNEKDFKGHNAALIAEDPKTGQILAMVGSRNYFGDPFPEGCTSGLNCQFDPQVNVALRPRQPGSSFKPIVYTAAFQRGFTADTPIWDAVTLFKAQPKNYEPHNYDDKEHGLVTLRAALAGSLNIPAVKLLYLTGVERVLDLADQLGYTTLADRSRFGLSLVLGGGEVKLIDHMGAFATLANDGTRLAQSSILRVEDSSGRALQEWSQPEPRQVIPATIAREITSILSDNNARAFMFGLKNYLTLTDRPIAAKTGTTNDFRDAWTLGFTPSLATGVWTGNNDNTAMGKKADGSQIAAPIWNAFMRRALEKTPVEKFPAPEPRATVNPLLRGQGIASTTARVNKTNGKIATALTAPELIEERTYMTVHSELFYLNKDDLSLPPPENPGADPNFETWEAAVRRYAEEHNIRAEIPPTEYDIATPAPTTPEALPLHTIPQ